MLTLSTRKMIKNENTNNLKKNYNSENGGQTNND